MSDPLVAKWLDDRASLTDEEASDLLRRLESDAGLAREAKDQLLADELLSRRLAPDRAHFENQIAQRLRTAGREGPFLASTLQAVGRVERRRAAVRRWSAEAAAALVVVASLFFLLLRREPTSLPAAPKPALPGLRAEYFATGNLRGESVARIDPRIDFAWPKGAGPLAGRGDLYSARWTGKIRARASGRHTFRVRNDDGVRIWIGGAPVIDDWIGRLYVSESRGSFDLEAGKVYDFRVEYFNGGDRGVVQLYWSAPGLPEEIIPSAQFSHE